MNNLAEFYRDRKEYAKAHGVARHSLKLLEAALQETPSAP